MKNYNDFIAYENRQKAPVSIYEGAFGASEPLRVTTLGAVLKEVQEGSPTLDALSKQLRQLKRDKPAEYSKLKNKKCPAFILGKFRERKNDAIEAYVPILGFDIDGTEDDTMVSGTIRDLRKVDYVFAAFPSPSGRGVRILVCTAATAQTHKQYYEAICQDLSQKLSIPTDKQLREAFKDLPAKELTAKIKGTEHIDTGTNNVARLWFYTKAPADCFYLNEQSQVFYLKPPPYPIPNSSRPPAGPVSEEDKVQICLEKVRNQRLPAGRNNFVFALASEMRQHDVSKQRAFDECRAYAEDFGDDPFTEGEIKKTVESAYKSKSVKYNDAQIKKYQAIQNGETVPSAAKQPRTKQEEEGKKPPNQSKFLRIKEYLSEIYDFRFNEVSNQIEVSLKDMEDYEQLNENDLICDLYEQGFTGVETPLIALLKSKFVVRYDPFKKYFEGLPPWDEQQPDYIEALANYVSCKDQHWFNQQFKKMLVRTVACAIGVIPFNKHCFVLKGKQNDGKTTFVRFLVPDNLSAYITENIDVHNKDGRIALCENMIINFDELSQFSKNDIRKVKALITIQSIKERLPYDRTSSTLRRRASFFGTTNDDEFLIDETGNVRWLVFEVDDILHDKGGAKGYNARIDINLVWAQAYTLLRSGFKFNLTREELKKSEHNNSSFQITTIEQELIQEFYKPGVPDAEGSEFVTATQVLQTIEHETKGIVKKINVGRALNILGFPKGQVFSKDKGYQQKGYWAIRIE